MVTSLEHLFFFPEDLESIPSTPVEAQTIRVIQNPLLICVVPEAYIHINVAKTLINIK